MKAKKGTIISAKMDQTVVVIVHTYKAHPKYKKRYRISRKFLAHNPDNKYQEGDEVTIMETKPLSKRKRWIVASEAE